MYIIRLDHVCIFGVHSYQIVYNTESAPTSYTLSVRFSNESSFGDHIEINITETEADAVMQTSLAPFSVAHAAIFYTLDGIVVGAHKAIVKRLRDTTTGDAYTYTTEWSSRLGSNIRAYQNKAKCSSYEFQRTLNLYSHGVTILTKNPNVYNQS